MLLQIGCAPACIKLEICCFQAGSRGQEGRPGNHDGVVEHAIDEPGCRLEVPGHLPAQHLDCEGDDGLVFPCPAYHAPGDLAFAVCAVHPEPAVVRVLLILVDPKTSDEVCTLVDDQFPGGVLHPFKVMDEVDGINIIRPLCALQVDRFMDAVLVEDQGAGQDAVFIADFEQQLLPDLVAVI